jgi:toxin FitB
LSFLLDTNVVSEARRGSREALNWLVPVPSERLFLSVITVGEIERGVLKLAKKDADGGKRLAEWLAIIRSDFESRLLPVTEEIALEWGRMSLCRSIGVADTLIAATALVHGMTLVTRNVRYFADTGVTLINPWAEG